jgi:hypothetical protein
MSTDFDILPDKVEVIKHHRFENNDIQSKEALKELISLRGRKKGQTYTLDRPDGYDIHPLFLVLSAA